MLVQYAGLNITYYRYKNTSKKDDLIKNSIRSVYRNLGAAETFIALKI